MVKNKKLNKHQSDNEESRSEFYSDVMLLSDLVSKHCTSLPLIVCTVSGHYGNNILEDMSANQVTLPIFKTHFNWSLLTKVCDHADPVREKGAERAEADDETQGWKVPQLPPRLPNSLLTT